MHALLFWLCFFAIGLAVWNRVTANDLARSISELQKELAILRRAAGGAQIALAAAPVRAPAPEAVFFEASSGAKSATPPPAPGPVAKEELKGARSSEKVFEPEQSPQTRSYPEAEDTGTVVDLERQFGARLPVWI